MTTGQADQLQPPTGMIEIARQAAMRSPCQKSKRGVVIWDSKNAIVADGFNGHPNEIFARCDGSDACRRDCAKLCVHAESRALAVARSWDYDFISQYGRSAMPELVMLHAKAVDGVVVPGGGPSCWQCSRDILEACIAGVWLFETTLVVAEHEALSPPVQRGPTGLLEQHEWTTLKSGEPVWRYYSAINFHRATLKACELGDLNTGWWREVPK